MPFEVVLYDRYSDVPLRGLLRSGPSILAFDACALDDEPSEIGDHPGIYSRVRGFECDDTLRLVLEQKDAVFREWRAAFDQGTADASTHPLYVNPRYQQLCRRADELFSGLGVPILEATGAMRVVSGSFVFECLDEISS